MPNQTRGSSAVCLKDNCGTNEPLPQCLQGTVNDEMIFDVADFYKVFGDSTRIKILLFILQGEQCVCQIADGLKMTQSAASHQLRVLRQNGLVKYRREGKTVYYSLDDEHVSLVLQQGLCHVLHKKAYV